MPLPKLARRALAPVFVGVELLLLAVFAVVTVVGALVAPLDRRRRILRTGVFALSYLAVEITALVACLGAWAVRRARPTAWWEDYHYRLLARALGAILTAARRCFGFVVVLDEPGGPGPFGEPAPILVLARHGGLGDSFALVWLLIDTYRRRVRVVLKAVLQWEPLLDVALNRVGACFLPSRGGQGEVLADRLHRLASGLSDHDALLLFPEGKNWTPRRRARAIQRLRADRKVRAARAAAQMPHVLPPRPAGVLACLEANDALGVVIMAHTGLDKLTTAAQTWEAIPFGEPMTVRWWTASPIPPEEAARVEWLTAEWADVDRWIERHGPDQARRGSPP